MESELNHGPVLLEFFLVQLIFTFKDFYPFWILIFKNTDSTLCKPVLFWDHQQAAYLYTSLFHKFSPGSWQKGWLLLFSPLLKSPYYSWRSFVEIWALTTQSLQRHIKQACSLLLAKLPTTQTCFSYTITLAVASCHEKWWVRGSLTFTPVLSFHRNASNLPKVAMRAFKHWITRDINVSGETERSLEIFYLEQWRKTAHLHTLVMPYVNAVDQATFSLYFFICLPWNTLEPFPWTGFAHTSIPCVLCFLTEPGNGWVFSLTKVLKRAWKALGVLPLILVICVSRIIYGAKVWGFCQERKATIWWNKQEPSGKEELCSKLQIIESIQNVGNASWEAGKVLNHLTAISGMLSTLSTTFWSLFFPF